MPGNRTSRQAQRRGCARVSGARFGGSGSVFQQGDKSVEMDNDDLEIVGDSPGELSRFNPVTSSRFYTVFYVYYNSKPY